MKTLLAIITAAIVINMSGCANATPEQRAMLERAGSVVLDAAAHRVAAEISGK